jgi:hypothetical protein
MPQKVSAFFCLKYLLVYRYIVFNFIDMLSKSYNRCLLLVLALLFISSVSFGIPRIRNVQSYLSPNPRFDIRIITTSDKNIERVERKQLNDGLQTMEISFYMIECSPSNINDVIDTTIFFASEFPAEVLIMLYADSASCAYIGFVDSLRLRGGQPVGVSEVQSLESKIHPTLIETNFSISPELRPNECLKLYTEDGKLVQEFCESQSWYSLQNIQSGRYVAVIEERNFSTRILKR